MSQTLSQSQEDYLETILGLSSDHGVARVRDIASRMEVSMPSVNGALKRLEKQDLIKHEKYEFVSLTPRGKRRANEVAGRHAVLRRFFLEFLKVGSDSAELDACSIEHHLTKQSFEAFEKLFNFIDNRGEGWLADFHASLQNEGQQK